MKAVKLNKIQWNLNNVEDEKRDEILKTLPVEKGFMVDDNFNVAESVPAILKKKFGYDIIDFSFTEYHVTETLEELLELCTPGGKTKDLFTGTGKLSQYGMKCRNNLEHNIKWRINLERKGTSPYAMPKLLDQIMLGVEKVTGLKWEDHAPDEFMAKISRMIWDKKAVNLADKFDKEDEEEEENENDE